MASRRLPDSTAEASYRGRLIALGAVVLIGAATLTQHGGGESRPWCIPCALRDPELAADLVANLILFGPFGVGLRLAGCRVRTVLVAAVALSVCVEVLQAYVIPGRVANVSDVVTNTMGAVAGAILAPRWRGAARPTAAAAFQLAVVALGVLTGIVAASAWALQLAYPRAAAVARRVDTRVTRDRSARVLHALVNGDPVRSEDTVRIPRPPARTIVELTLQAPHAWGDADLGLRLVAERRRFLEVGIEDDDLRLGVRRNGAALRLLSPAVRLPRSADQQAEHPQPGRADTVHLRAVVSDWRMSLTAGTRATHDTLALRLHPLAGWSLLVSSARWSWINEVLTALWAGLLVFPFAYWSGAAAAHRPGLALGAVLALGCGIGWAVGAAAGAPPPPWTAVLSLLLVSLAAFRLGRAARATPADDRRAGGGVASA